MTQTGTAFNVIEMTTEPSAESEDGFVATVAMDRLEDGEMEPFEIDGRKIVLARVGSSTYAFDESCTHKRCSLLEGDIEEDLVSCPCHGAEFDPVTGEVLVGPATIPLPAHETRVKDDTLMVRLSATPPIEGL